MKSILMLSSLLISSSSAFASERLSLAKDWFSQVLPSTLSFNVESTKIRFSGCKQKEYQLNLNQPLSENFTLESSLSYGKARLSWGVFSQKISVKEIAVLPRYHINHLLSVGIGVVHQGAIEFKNTLGLAFDLPSNNEVVLSARAPGFYRKHQWELSVSSQKWKTTQENGTWYERGAANSKINLVYTGYF